MILRILDRNYSRQQNGMVEVGEKSSVGSENLGLILSGQVFIEYGVLEKRHSEKDGKNHWEK